MKKIMRLAKLLAFALSFLIFCFPTAAMADTCSSPENPVIPQPLRYIKIDNGSFNVDTNIRCLKESKRIDTAVVFLEHSTATKGKNYHENSSYFINDFAFKYLSFKSY
ncbi:hypothetical protein [Microcoleus sp. D2_18a_D3]|uniref:hypothetical protein n=1 Tax=Microcoleus sp. D2_18a_D3 TaxID=3055330 RepID=UPI002FD601E0